VSAAGEQAGLFLRLPEIEDASPVRLLKIVGDCVGRIYALRNNALDAELAGVGGRDRTSGRPRSAKHMCPKDLLEYRAAGDPGLSLRSC
jgi:hypothetical protein